MKKLLVTTDFSGNSKAGIRYALRLAEDTGCSLVFYHCVEVIKPTAWNDFRFATYSRSRISLFSSRLVRYIDGICREYGFNTAGHSYDVEIGTDVPAMIIRRARKVKADAICMSTRGAGRLKKLFGTNAAEVIKTSPLPVFVVPRKFRVSAIDKVMYASDFSAPRRELNALHRFFEPLKHTTHVYHYDYLLDVDTNRRRLEQKASALSRPYTTFTFRKRMIENTLSSDLRKDIRKEKPSMVVLFTKPNHGWFDRFFNRSEAWSFSLNPQVPLLVMRKNKHAQLPA
jgi:nucleotide-binding universal stress UspA family protein